MAMHELEEYDMLHAGEENENQNQENLIEVQCDNPYINSNILNTEIDMSYSKDIIEHENMMPSLNITNNDKLNEAFCSEKDLKDMNESGNFNSPDKMITYKKKLEIHNSGLIINAGENIFEPDPEREINKLDKLETYHKGKIIF
jgi:hypothetical protein